MLNTERVYSSIPPTIGGSSTNPRFLLVVKLFHYTGTVPEAVPVSRLLCAVSFEPTTLLVFSNPLPSIVDLNSLPKDYRPTIRT